jgi:hypothetical protein
MRRMAVVLTATAGALLAPATPIGAQSGPGGPNHDFAVGAGKGTFVTGGPAALRVSGHSDPGGADPTGHVRAKGDLDGDAGPLEPFGLEGEVTCLRVEGNRAAIKYRFKHAQGSADPALQDGGVQIFLEDNGPPQGGQPVDRTAFDPPQTAETFETNATACDDPTNRPDYDTIDSGNFTVHEAP